MRKDKNSNLKFIDEVKNTRESVMKILWRWKLQFVPIYSMEESELMVCNTNVVFKIINYDFIL